jgi:hypothetical protein
MASLFLLLLLQLAGYCAWPALVWSLELCAKATWPDIITSYVPGEGRQPAAPSFHVTAQLELLSCKADESITTAWWRCSLATQLVLHT